MIKKFILSTILVIVIASSTFAAETFFRPGDTGSITLPVKNSTNSVGNMEGVKIEATCNKANYFTVKPSSLLGPQTISNDTPNNSYTFLIDYQISPSASEDFNVTITISTTTTNCIPNPPNTTWIVEHKFTYFNSWPVPASKKIGGTYGDYRVHDQTTGDGDFHLSIDIESDIGSEVKAVSGGRTVEIGEDLLKGDWIKISVSDTESKYHVYSHLQNIDLTKVEVGKLVGPGVKIAEIIGIPIDTAPYWYPHLDFCMKNDLGGIDNPLAIFNNNVVDNVNPTVSGIWFREQGNEGSYFNNIPPSISDAVSAWGKIDIVAKVFDEIRESSKNEQIPTYKPGICKIGYQIPETPLGVDPINTSLWLIEFKGPLINNYTTKPWIDIYSTQADHKSDSYNFNYIVTNTNVNRTNFWNTKKNKDNNITEDAKVNSEAKFKDGLYKIKIDAFDYHGNTDNTENSKKNVVVDNFRPFVQKIEVINSNNSNEKYYQAEWLWNSVTNKLEFKKVYDQIKVITGGSASTYTTKITFSEPVTGPSLTIGTLPAFSLTQNAIDPKIWTSNAFSIVAQTYNGQQIMTISANDLAGNTILQTNSVSPIDPAVSLTRNTSGIMQGTSGDDTIHKINIQYSPEPSSTDMIYFFRTNSFDSALILQWRNPVNCEGVKIYKLVKPSLYSTYETIIKYDTEIVYDPNKYTYETMVYPFGKVSYNDFHMD